MEKLTEKTKVVFRIFKDDGSLVALFPNEIADPHGNIMSYQHIGQHGAADYSYCIQKSRPARPEEYADLVRELQGLGYNLDIRTRRG